MNYKDLKEIADSQNMMIKDLANQLDFSPNGLKVSIEKGTYPINKVGNLCNLLGITPNEFFGWPTTGNIATAGSIQAVGNNISQSVGDVVAVLERQLREKDKQISELLKHLK